MSNNENAPPATAVPQQQPSPSQTNSNVQSLAQPNVGGDSLVCQWQNCGERCTTAEQLYDHVCERHVGRKSTNNLNLTCQWGNCRTTTVKRDHITSHIRVHVPLKPHKCDFCGKAFKRPQDLKKHVKTHADDSVLLRSPEPARGGGGGVGYSAQAGKLVADLQSLAATASGYYPDHHQIAGQPVYYQNGGANASAYHGPAQTQQGSAYGPVYYAVSQPQNTNAEYELRKRAAFDALNEFFGEAKQRRIDPTTYYDVGHRLMALQNVQAPILSGGYSAGGVSDYQSGGGVQTATQPQLLQSQYSLPLPNARTKNDLLNIDQFLEQLQSTVYENSNQAAAAGVAQHGTYVHGGVAYRNSNSPPQLPHIPNLSAHAQGVPVSSAANDTPALTPASSVLSYTSGHSPSSVHSSHTISPITRPNIMGSMYPTLPAVSAMSEGPSGYPTSSAPPSGLATAFDADPRRRYSGGQLQKEAPSGDRMDIDDTPSPTETSDDKMPKIEKLGVRSPSIKNVDPALRSPGMQSDTSDSTDKAQESWIENVRIIEALRHFVQEKLERGDYEEDSVSPKEEAEDSDAKSLYPVLRSVQEDA